MTGHELSTDAWSTAAAADAYERARPGYAADAIAFIVSALSLDRESRLLDLGAGTGKLTRQFVPLVGTMVAVEPLAAMRDALTRHVKGISVLAGTGEALPLPAASVDAVVAGQAWHWFDSAKALAEVERVTGPTGGLALLWNDYDHRWPLVEQFNALGRERRRSAPTHVDNEWRLPLDNSRVWEPLRQNTFYHSMPMTRDLLADRMLTSSVMVILPADEKETVRRQVLSILSDTLGDSGDMRLDVPYQTEVFWTLKRA